MHYTYYDVHISAFNSFVGMPWQWFPTMTPVILLLSPPLMPLPVGMLMITAPNSELKRKADGIIHIITIIRDICIICNIRIICIMYIIFIILFWQDGWSRYDPRFYTSLTIENPYCMSSLLSISWENFLLCQLGTQARFRTTCATCFQAHLATAGRVLAMDAGCGSSTHGQWRGPVTCIEWEVEFCQCHPPWTFLIE